MPAVSGKQYRFMQAVAHGAAHLKSLSPEKAEEFIYATPPKKRKMFSKKGSK